MSDFQGQYNIRDGVPNDKAFILATFLRGLYYGDSWFSLMPKDVFMANYSKVGEALLTNPNVLIKVACMKDDPDVILGYSILSADYQAVTWVHVKKVWRKHGIGKSLVPRHPVSVSHLTTLGKTLLPKIGNPIFNPFKLT